MSSDSAVTPTREEISRNIENRKDKYTHTIIGNESTVEAANGEKFVVKNVVQYGEYGDVYTVHSTSRGTKLQMRTELVKAPKSYQTFTTMASLHETFTICKDPYMRKHFPHTENVRFDKEYKYIFTELIGPTLGDVRRHHVKTNFPIGDALNLVFQCYFAVEYLHTMGYVHGDLNLSSYSLGVGDKESCVYLTHFGRLRKHIDAGTNLPVKQRQRVAFIGRDMIYAPRSAHKRKDFGRRDDLESWLYISSDLFDDASPPWKPKKKKEIMKDDEMLRQKEIFMGGNREMRATFFAFYPKELQKIPGMIAVMDYDTKPYYEGFKLLFYQAKERIGPPMARKWRNLSLDMSKYPAPRRPINNSKKRKGGVSCTQDMPTSDEMSRAKGVESVYKPVKDKTKSKKRKSDDDNTEGKKKLKSVTKKDKKKAQEKKKDAGAKSPTPSPAVGQSKETEEDKLLNLAEGGSAETGSSSRRQSQLKQQIGRYLCTGGGEIKAQKKKLREEVETEEDEEEEDNQTNVAETEVEEDEEEPSDKEKKKKNTGKEAAQEKDEKVEVIVINIGNQQAMTADQVMQNPPVEIHKQKKKLPYGGVVDEETEMLDAPEKQQQQPNKNNKEPQASEYVPTASKQQKPPPKS